MTPSLSPAKGRARCPQCAGTATILSSSSSSSLLLDAQRAAGRASVPASPIHLPTDPPLSTLHFQLSTVLVLAFLLSSIPSALACSVPVFRYALERWPASPYEAVVFHRGA